MFDGKPLIEKELSYCVLDATWPEHNGNLGGFRVAYGAKGFGFGNITFVINKDGSLTCDNERENRETVKYILSCLVDRAEFRDSREHQKEEKEVVKKDKIKHGNGNRKWWEEEDE